MDPSEPQLGACLTLATSESPSDAAACSLSSILETGEHLRRYSLSPKACAGILRRAARRGRELPMPLWEPLFAVGREALSEQERETLAPR
jgi:hypothetical protein